MFFCTLCQTDAVSSVLEKKGGVIFLCSLLTVVSLSPRGAVASPCKEEIAALHVLLREEEEGVLSALLIVLLRLVSLFFFFPSPLVHTTHLFERSPLALSSHHLTAMFTLQAHSKRRRRFATQNAATRQRKEGGRCSIHIF